MLKTNRDIKILVIDDDEDDFFILSDFLKNIPDNNYRVDWCFDLSQALTSLKEKNYDLYFVDYRLGMNTGMDFLKAAVREGNEDPVIFLTGKGNKEVDIQAMQEGAMDYLVKAELNVEKLERSVRYALERAQSLKALKENERKYRTIFESSKDAVFITDEAFNFKYVNPATCELLDLTNEDLTGKNFFDFLYDRNQKDKVLEHLRENGLSDVEIVLIGSTGEKKECIISGELENAMVDEPYIQCVVHDITSFKKAERINLQAEKLAATGRLIQLLAHEVRNPLNNINLSVEQLMTEQPEDDENLPLYQIIKRNSTRISKLIDELLASSNTAELTFRSVDLHSIIEESLLAASDRIALKEVDVETKYLKGPIYINADSNKLKIALSNIIINGIEAMESNEAKGKLLIETTASQDSYILKIKDNGCGIPEENLSKLFEPYFTSKKNGMGLGLASTLNILQAHKTGVEVQSAKNSGTTFLLSFKPAEEITITNKTLEQMSG